MTPTKTDFMGLLDSLDQLKERRMRIEHLRDAYFAALQDDDSAKENHAIEEAAREGVELLQYLPLSELREVKQIEKLAHKLAENKGLLEDGRTLIALRDTNVEALLAKVNALGDVIKRLKEANSSVDQLVSRAEIGTGKLSSLGASLEAECAKLNDPVQRVQEALACSRVQDALLRLNFASLKDYTQSAAGWLRNAREALQQLPTSLETFSALEEQTASAEAQHNAAMTLRGDHEVDRRLSNIESGLDRSQALSADDVIWLSRIVRENPKLPPVLVRLLARADEVKVAEPSRLGEFDSEWWSDWNHIRSKEGAGSLADKEQLLRQLGKRIENRERTGGLVGGERSIWYQWRARISQAQEMLQSLQPFVASAPTPALAADVTAVRSQSSLSLFRYEQEYLAGWRTMGRWLEQAYDEVFAILAEEWLSAHDALSDSWEQHIIDRRTARLGSRERQARIGEMRACLEPYRAAERARAKEKERRGLDLIEKMSASPSPRPGVAMSRVAG